MNGGCNGRVKSGVGSDTERYVKTVDGQRVDFGSNAAEELKKMIPEVKKEEGVDFSITYSDMYRNRYETKQSLRFSTDPTLPGMSGVILQFKGRNPIEQQASPSRQP